MGEMGGEKRGGQVKMMEELGGEGGKQTEGQETEGKEREEGRIGRVIGRKGKRGEWMKRGRDRNEGRREMEKGGKERRQERNGKGHEEATKTHNMLGAWTAS